MKTNSFLQVAFLVAAEFCAAVAPGVAATPPSTPVAFVDVTVLTMNSERTLPNQTVVIKGDRIVEIGSASAVKIPAGAQQIAGTGKFLIPGLGEMHGHNPAVGSPPEMFEQVFFLFVANGVTTVRSMLGFPGQLEWREKARRGDIIAPTLYLAGPSFTGNGPGATTTPQQAIDRVRAQKAEGWDLLKVHPGLKLAVYDAMAKTAKEVGLEFSGHIPADVGLIRAIDRGQKTVDHLDGYIEHLNAKNGPIDPVRLAEIVKKTRDTNTWVVPTMVLWETILGSAKADEMAAFPELKYMPRRMVENWKTSYEKKVGARNFNAREATQIADNRKVLIKALADGGANIIFGTDAPQQFSVPGFSIHREMKAMKDAGMSNFAILQSATKNVGEYLKARDQFGTVAVGQRADLLLLHANPLLDLANVAKRAGVMVRGKWMPEAEIQARLQKIAAANAR
jgi:imidazolonepropionase-like amidohydrolase